MILVGVLGGGLQGCCTAIALAARRVRVTLFDKNDALLSRAAIANEGKIHLGYMYAGDPTLSTAKTMMAGALAFAPFLERYLARPAHAFSLSLPATYIVHRDSQHSAEDVCAYLKTVHRLINEAADGRKQAYFGKDLSAQYDAGLRRRKQQSSTRKVHLQQSPPPRLRLIPSRLLKSYGSILPRIRLSKCAAAALFLERRWSATASVC